MGLKRLFSSKNKISKARRDELVEFCAPLGIRFRDCAVLDLAFHHKSFSNEDLSGKNRNNERLEFLGDSVLGLAVASFLYQDMTRNSEGELAKIKSGVVSEATLAVVAVEKMHVDKYLLLGKGEELSGGRQKKAILADTVEAVIGALYLDSGYESAERLALKLIVPEIRKAQNDEGEKDYKTLLQEYVQKKSGERPVYSLVKTTGPDHDKVFHVKVSLSDASFGPAKGKSKKAAEQKAASLACKALGID